MRNQAALEYLVIIGAVVLIAGIVAYVVAGSAGTSKSSVLYSSCRQAATQCGILKAADPNANCSSCYEQCVDPSNESELFTGAIDCCLQGNTTGIFEGSTGCAAGCVPTEATETTCDDGIDNDCDGLIDCADYNCAGDPACSTCVDADGDGYYSPTNCATGNDCNDSNPSANPGATEICDNGIDDDCDGYIDSQDSDCSVCGNGVCEPGEDYLTCPSDCPSSNPAADSDQTQCTADIDMTLGDEGVAYDDALFKDPSTYGTPSCCGNNENEWLICRNVEGSKNCNYLSGGASASCYYSSDCVNFSTTVGAAGACFNNGTGTSDYWCDNTVWRVCSDPSSDLGKTAAGVCCAGTSSSVSWTANPKEDDYSCSDGIDNDCDGLVDCADSDCYNAPSCLVLGWAVGDNGIIYNTTHGGDVWSQQNSNTNYDINGIDCINMTYCFAVGDNGRFLNTTDGGETWSEQVISSKDLYSVHFKYPFGWAVGEYGEILNTSDGGVTWSQQNSGTTTESLNSVDFVTPAYGFIGADGGVILKTTNGGDTWSLHLTGFNSIVWDIDFVDFSIGFAVDQSGNVLKTTNGGLGWDSVLDAGNSLYSIDCVDPAVCFAVGENGLVLNTSDGGSTWSEQAITTLNLWSIDCLNSSHCWAVGSSGKIFNTSDGGATWSEQDLGAGTFNSVDFTLWNNDPFS